MSKRLPDTWKTNVENLNALRKDDNLENLGSKQLFNLWLINNSLKKGNSDN